MVPDDLFILKCILIKHLMKAPKIHSYAQTLLLCCNADILLIRFIVILTVKYSGSTQQLIVLGS